MLKLKNYNIAVGYSHRNECQGQTNSNHNSILLFEDITLIHQSPLYIFISIIKLINILR